VSIYFPEAIKFHSTGEFIFHHSLWIGGKFGENICFAQAWDCHLICGIKYPRLYGSLGPKSTIFPQKSFHWWRNTGSGYTYFKSFSLKSILTSFTILLDDINYRLNISVLSNSEMSSFSLKAFSNLSLLSTINPSYYIYLNLLIVSLTVAWNKSKLFPLKVL